MKVKSLKNLVKRLFNATITGSTVCEVLNNIETPNEILIKSSTTDSTKVFKIIVNDSGTITAAEVSE